MLWDLRLYLYAGLTFLLYFFPFYTCMYAWCKSECQYDVWSMMFEAWCLKYLLDSMYESFPCLLSQPPHEKPTINSSWMFTTTDHLGFHIVHLCPLGMLCRGHYMHRGSRCHSPVEGKCYSYPLQAGTNNNTAVATLLPSWTSMLASPHCHPAAAEVTKTITLQQTVPVPHSTAPTVSWHFIDFL